MREYVAETIARYGYAVRDGVITSPGKFEGEPEWLPAVWEAALEGRADREVMDGDTPVSCFAHDPEIVDLLGPTHLTSPDLYLAVWEDDQGFVRHNPSISARALDRIEEDQDHE